MSKKLSLFLLACTGITLFWSLVTPAFEFPDEQAHFGTISFLKREGRVPVGPEFDMTPEMARTQELLGVYRNPQGQNSYTYHPEFHVPYSDSLTGPSELDILALNAPDLRTSYVATEAARYPRAYYDYENLFVELVNSADIITRLFVARLSGAFLVLVSSYFAYQLGLVLFKSSKYATTLTLMLTLQPMASFLSAGVNSDNLHNTLFVIILYAGTKLVSSGIAFSPVLIGTLAALLDIYTKPQGVLAIVILGLALFVRAIKDRSWRIILLFFALSIGFVYLGWGKLSPYLGILTSINLKGASFSAFLHFSLNKLATQNVVWYWGVFKWLGVVLPAIYWQVANRVVLLSGVGLIVYIVKIIKKKKVLIPLSSFIFLLLSILIYTFSIYYFDWHHTKVVGFSLGVQARYFFPTMVAQFALMLTGITALGWTDKVKSHLLKGLVLIFVWLQLGGLWTLVSSYYDTSSVNTLVNQISQYKPIFAKGDIWYLYLLIYLLSLYVLTRRATKDN